MFCPHCYYQSKLWFRIFATLNIIANCVIQTRRFVAKREYFHLEQEAGRLVSIIPCWIIWVTNEDFCCFSMYTTFSCLRTSGKQLCWRQRFTQSVKIFGFMLNVTLSYRQSWKVYKVHFLRDVCGFAEYLSVYFYLESFCWKTYEGSNRFNFSPWTR